MFELVFVDNVMYVICIVKGGKGRRSSGLDGR